MKSALTLIIILTFISASFAQNSDWLEKLGYTSDTKLLIIHGDDLGVTHSVNKASIRGFEEGLMNSCSIMMPCPWFEEIKEYALEHPEYDYGLHLTLTAEWKHLKWRGLADIQDTRGLYDENDYLNASVPPVILNSNVEEVEIELRAQIDKAIKSGIKPSHLDSHMGTLYAKEEFTSLLIRLGEEYKIPVFLPAQVISAFPNLKLSKKSIITNNVYMNSILLEREEAFNYYDGVIKDLKPGLNEIIVHLGINNEELIATCVDHLSFGSAWRQHDLDYVTSPHLAELIKENNIHLITWKEIQKVLYER